MRFLAAGILLILILLLGLQIYNFEAQSGALAKQAQELKVQLDKAQQNYQQLQGDFQYLQNPINLEKELRARFNYKALGEKMIILVPNQSTSATPTN